MLWTSLGRKQECYGTMLMYTSTLKNEKLAKGEVLLLLSQFLSIVTSAFLGSQHIEEIPSQQE